MRNLQRFFASALTLALLAVPAFSVNRTMAAVKTSAQQTTGALERGYRTGYSDGYQSGFSDSAERAERDYRSKDEYERADRAYAASYGSLEDYRDGYKQGFEVGYEGGYERRVFDSTVPVGISRRGNIDNVNDDRASVADDDMQSSNSSSSSGSGRTTSGGAGGTVATQPAGSPRTGGGSFTIPPNTEMRVELLTNLSSDASQKGDRFQARVIEPTQYQGAMIQGRVARVKRSGRVKGASEIQLSFEQISINGRWSNFEAQVVEVVSRGGTGVGDVDEEGGVRGTGSTRDDITKIGAGTAIGAIIGAIAGGGKGAAIGAAIGGAIGTGGAISSRGSDIRLPAGQELVIRTSNYTRIQ
jgi:hypothetical protein